MVKKVKTISLKEFKNIVKQTILEEIERATTEPEYIGSFYSKETNVSVHNVSKSDSSKQETQEVSEARSYVGNFPEVGDRYDVYVFQDDPGNYPHVHVICKGRNLVSCIRLDTNMYFKHNPAHKTLPGKASRDFDDFMHKIDSAMALNGPGQTYYRSCVDAWNRNNSQRMLAIKKDSNGNDIIPDYKHIRDNK